MTTDRAAILFLAQQHNIARNPLACFDCCNCRPAAIHFHAEVGKVLGIRSLDGWHLWLVQMGRHIGPTQGCVCMHACASWCQSAGPLATHQTQTLNINTCSASMPESMSAVPGHAYAARRGCSSSSGPCRMLATTTSNTSGSFWASGAENRPDMRLPSPACITDCLCPAASLAAAAAAAATGSGPSALGMQDSEVKRASTPFSVALRCAHRTARGSTSVPT
jgi:hypothetical protein